MANEKAINLETLGAFKEEADNHYQGKLTAGTNITISEDNVISASGGGGSSLEAGVGITIEDNKINVDLDDGPIAQMPDDYIVVTSHTHNAIGTFTQNKPGYTSININSDESDTSGHYLNDCKFGDGFCTYKLMSSGTTIVHIIWRKNAAVLGSDMGYDELVADSPITLTYNEDDGKVHIGSTGGGGTTYTAGDNITISEENVISATVPTKTSDLENDSGFLTEHQDISGLVPKSAKSSNHMAFDWSNTNTGTYVGFGRGTGSTSAGGVVVGADFSNYGADGKIQVKSFTSSTETNFATIDINHNITIDNGGYTLQPIGFIVNDPYDTGNAKLTVDLGQLGSSSTTGYYGHLSLKQPTSGENSSVQVDLTPSGLTFTNTDGTTWSYVSEESFVASDSSSYGTGTYYKNNELKMWYGKSDPSSAQYVNDINYKNINLYGSYTNVGPYVSIDGDSASITLGIIQNHDTSTIKNFAPVAELTFSGLNFTYNSEVAVVGIGGIKYTGSDGVTHSLANKADKTDIPSLEGYATEEWVGEQGYLTEHQDLSAYALKSEIPDVSDMETKTEAAETYQPKLTAGTNITISDDNVISASGGSTYTAGTNISISEDNVISATDTKYTAGKNIKITDTSIALADRVKMYYGDTSQAIELGYGNAAQIGVTNRDLDTGEGSQVEIGLGDVTLKRYPANGGKPTTYTLTGAYVSLWEYEEYVDEHFQTKLTDYTPSVWNAKQDALTDYTPSVWNAKQDALTDYTPETWNGKQNALTGIVDVKTAASEEEAMSHTSDNVLYIVEQ